MDVIYARQEATAAEVLAGLPDPPSYSAVRALLRILEEKKHLRHKKIEGRYVYLPTRTRGNAGKSAIQRVLQTFFDNSATQAVAALLDVSDSKLSDSELDEMERLIAEAKKRGQQP
jgi:BlaI family transcriptional regulator, penicillinase repressor